MPDRVHLVDFFALFLAELRAALPAERQDFQTRIVRNLIKVYYGSPGLHYEVWLRGHGRLELGLHFEADAVTNRRLVERFSERALDILGELGPQVEVEQWTKSWGRVHETMPFDRPSAALAHTAAQRLASYIAALQPILEEA